ncbi:MAG TPA: glycosyltransferase family 2 protein [Blastocatellia bacterium]|nr:glycosyltransferase family 2 protein [Blastocatellia bacterium]
MLKPPRISIITPTLNQAGFIDQTISSVLGQGYPDLEFIIIDGGSTDGTVDLIRKHERHLAYWVSEKDAGQSNAINKGLKRATGDIIAYINSDDYYLDGAFKRVADAYRENPDIDLWYGRCRIVDQFGAKVDERIGSIERYDEILDLWDVWWKRRNFVQPEVFWTKRISKKVGAFREDLNLVMDYEYWLRIFAAGGAARFIDAELAAFRLQPNQKSTQPARTAQELLEVVQPYLFAPSDRLTHQKRRTLQAKWIYQAGFLNEVERSLDRDEARWRRLMRLAWFSATNPRVMTAPGFWERVPGIRSFSNRTTAQS